MKLLVLGISWLGEFSVRWLICGFAFVCVYLRWVVGFGWLVVWVLIALVFSGYFAGLRLMWIRIWVGC